MAAAVYNITIDAQADFARTFEVSEAGVALDITGYTFAAQVREHFHSTDSTAFTTQIVDGPTGLFSISLTDTVTAAMTYGKQYYDIVMTDVAGDKQRLLQGEALVAWGITR
tara:strand:+ start:249 stop:581 length:333 start_codon:yes stop_codon:yes gene_type:complete